MSDKKNNSEEQKLIDLFLKSDNVKEKISGSCRAKNEADIEFIDKENFHWAMEVKTHRSSDKYNARHKIFGELLKLQYLYKDKKDVHLALLIEGGLDTEGKQKGKEFFQDGLKYIDKKKYLDFAKLANVEKVFIFDSKTKKTEELSWEEFYPKE